MKRFILISTLATLACLFVAGQALSAENQNTGMMGTSDSKQAPGMMNEGQHQGMMGEGQQEGMMGEKTQHGMVSQNLNPEQIREAQKLLNERGLKAGAVDGILGKQTRTAISDFQKSEKLGVTGKLDDPTLRALAPTTEKQEFFGLSPAYGEPGNKTMEKQSEPVQAEPANK